MEPQAPTGSGRRFQRHVFVCTSDSSCGPAGSGEVHRALKDRLVAAGLKEEVRVNKAGCLGQCGHGPVMVVYPEGVWYAHLSVDEAVRVWEEHVLGGAPVEELRYVTFKGGCNVVPFLGLGDRRPDVSSPWWDPCSRCVVPSLES